MILNLNFISETVTTIAGWGSGSINGLGTSSRFNGPHELAYSTTGLLYVADSDNYDIRLINLGGRVSFAFRLRVMIGNFAGRCGAGSYVKSPTLCTLVPRGYYEPPQAFSDNYYLCPAGYYSPTVGATACKVCAVATSPGSTSCVASCLAGSYSLNATCVVAPTGKFNSKLF